MQWKGLSISPCNLCPRECLAHRAEGQRACAAGGLQVAAGYSAAPDYPEVAKGALGEMADTVESRSLMRMV